ncbi:MAG TPA: tetratricopeptide repeat protein [Pyrinomonadaceae bacterium]|nr:tetratricopeptide repeat protein [Pyrinomonadaceae bacterium]
MQRLEVVNVFIASPSDLGSERKAFRLALERLNKLKAKGMGYSFEPLGWEDALPGGGRPQKLINDDVRRCDIFVMLLWKRWGTPTGSKKFTSGTEEEFSIAFNRFKKTGSPHLLLYFRSVPQAQMADPGDQLKKVNAFRTKIDMEKELLYKVYDRPQQWEDFLMDHLSKWLDGKKAGRGYDLAQDGTAAAAFKELAEMRRQLQELQREIKRADATPKTEESKLRRDAIGHAVEATRLLEAGKLARAEEEFAKSVEMYEEPEVLNNYGLFLYQIGALDRAKERFEKVIKLPAGGEADPHRARAFKMLGNVYLTWGKLPDAEKMFKQAIAIARQQESPKALADFLGSLGNVYIERGQIAKAEQTYRKALKIVEGEEDLDGMRKAHGSLGNIYVERGQAGKAEAAFGKALELAEQLKHKEGMGSASLGLGLVYELQGEPEKAEAMYRKALKIAQSLGFKAGMERAYGNLGNLYRDRDAGKAEDMYREALMLATLLGHKDGMAHTLCNLGHVYKKLGAAGKARKMWAQSLDIYQEIGSREGVRSLRTLLGGLKRGGPAKRAAKAARGGASKPKAGQHYRVISTARGSAVPKPGRKFRGYRPMGLKK